MRFEQKVVIHGMRKTDGSDEGGQRHFKTTVAIQDDMAPGYTGGQWKNKTRGMCTVDVPAGDGDVYEKLEGYALPMEAMVTFVSEVKKGVHSNRIENIRPSGQPTKKAA